MIKNSDDVVLFVMFIFIVVLLVTGLADMAQSQDDPGVKEVESHITWFHRNVSQKKKNKALKLAPAIVAEARARDFDPLLVSTIISLESGFQPSAEGGLGELGLMQVIPRGPCSKGQDLKTPEGHQKDS